MSFNLEELNNQCQSLNPADLFAFLQKNFDKEEITFSTSLSHEDQIILDYITKGNYLFRTFFIDTGRHFQETWDLFQKTVDQYGSVIHVEMLETQKLASIIREKGPNFFYSSVENRKECCYLRKVIPLKRALQGKKVWITGIRKGQSITRTNMTRVEWDSQYQLFKVHPLLDWDLKQVESFIQENKIPCNSLYQKGFKSIGCQPCTRAIEPGQDIRSGRWWWESPEHKECGLHKN